MEGVYQTIEMYLTYNQIPLESNSRSTNILQLSSMVAIVKRSHWHLIKCDSSSTFSPSSLWFFLHKSWFCSPRMNYNFLKIARGCYYLWRVSLVEIVSKICILPRNQLFWLAKTLKTLYGYIHSTHFGKRIGSNKLKVLFELSFSFSLLLYPRLHS